METQMCIISFEILNREKTLICYRHYLRQLTGS